jgi:anaerobic selenocysteine-containing dehydrogenase
VDKNQSSTVERWEKSYCPYCGVGCGLLAGMSNGAVTKIKGDPDHPSSLGDLCLKAVYLPEILRTDDRLTYPQVRQCQDGPFKRASWPQATTYLAKRFRTIIDEHGPDAVAFYGSGQLTTEEYYVANKLAKGFLGTNNFDTNSRLCMASAVAGIKRRLVPMARQLRMPTSTRPIACFSSVPTPPTATR